MKGVIPSLCHKSKQSWPNFFDTRPGGSLPFQMRARFRMIRALRDSLVKAKSGIRQNVCAAPEKKFLPGWG